MIPVRFVQPPLYVLGALSALTAILLIIAMMMALRPAPSIFLIKARTSRVEYQVPTPAARDNASVFVRGARVTVGNAILVEILDANDGDMVDACFTGLVRPYTGTAIVFDLEGGNQRLTLRRDLTRPYVGGDTSEENEATVGALYGFEGNLQIGRDEKQSVRNPLFLGDMPKVPEVLDLGETAQFYIDPECASDESGTHNIGFGMGSEALFIDGPGQLGRESSGIDRKNGLRVNRYAETLEGHVDIMVRSELCRKYLRFTCNRLFRVGDLSTALRPGAAVTPGFAQLQRYERNVGSRFRRAQNHAVSKETRRPAVSDAHSKFGSLQGYVQFVDGFYEVNASVEAMSLFILVPDPDIDRFQDDQLSVSFNERLVAEPIIVGLFSFLVGLLGITIGLAQVEPRRD